MSDHILPQAVDTEKAILSMMSISPSEIIPKLIKNGANEEFFYVPAHRVIWNLFIERYNNNLSLDAISICQELEDRKELDSVGGAAGLMEIISTSTPCALFDQYFDVLKDKYLRRKIIAESHELIQKGFDTSLRIEEIAEESEKNSSSVRKILAEGSTWSLKDDLRKVVDNIECFLSGEGEIFGCSTGFPKLDQMTNGLRPGEMFIIAARPSMGKTAFMLNITEHFLFEMKKPVLLFSLEMTSVQLVERLLFAHAGVSKAEILKNKGASKETLKKIMRTVNEMQKLDLIIDDTPAITLTQLRAKADAVKKENPGLAAIGIDYLQLMRSSSKQAQSNREREIAEISSGLKQVAKEIGVPILVLAQLNRGPETRTGKNKGVPMMSDLRESGAIEQDADMIGLLYRKRYYAEGEDEKEEAGDDAELILAKNRNGETGIVPLSFKAELMKFEQRDDYDNNF